MVNKTNQGQLCECGFGAIFQTLIIQEKKAQLKEVNSPHPISMDNKLLKVGDAL